MTTEPKKLKSAEIRERMGELVQRNYLHFELKGLTKGTRDIISDAVNGIMDRVGANPLNTFHLFSGLMEALLNAVKGNIRYTIFKKEIKARLFDVEPSSQDVEQLLEIILNTSPLRDAIQRYIVPDKIKRDVLNILTWEEKIRVRKLELKTEERVLLQSIRDEIKKDERKISLKIRVDKDMISIRLRNDSPIMDIDMERIRESREKHYHLYLEGKSSDFFRPEFLDEKESAGFGIAMIDEGYYNMKLNPMEYFTYIQGQHATTVYMNYPIEALCSMDF
ncbi:MAG TPA: hypothetical protein PK453_11670 [Leptospiraceae bacterium]|nr:hypothetical protein [Leptospiraceae bacterium]HMY66408.1 hypothetical protein [Leptospiraceae bacterium]HNF14320.1 hypothetical protein [Leptospiraceae bacterium]HNF25337.1 hypothetical protein [Leptospiraceae bacterium]HNH08194.1 hypothetical protein [Leptospiraceae bacterium]